MLSSQKRARRVVGKPHFTASLLCRGPEDLFCSFLSPREFQCVRESGALIRPLAITVSTLSSARPVLFPTIIKENKLAESDATIEHTAAGCVATLSKNVNGNAIVQLPQGGVCVLDIEIAGEVDTIVVDMLNGEVDDVRLRLLVSGSVGRVCVLSDTAVVTVTGVPSWKVNGAKTTRDVVYSLATRVEMQKMIQEDENDAKSEGLTYTLGGNMETSKKKTTCSISRQTFVENTAIFIPRPTSTMLVERCVFKGDVDVVMHGDSGHLRDMPHTGMLPCTTILMGEKIDCMDLNICDISSPSEVYAMLRVEPVLRYSAGLTVVVRGSFVKGWPSLIRSTVTQSTITGQSSMLVDTRDNSYPMAYNGRQEDMAEDAMRHTRCITVVAFTGCTCMYRRMRRPVHCEDHQRRHFNMAKLFAGFRR